MLEGETFGQCFDHYHTSLVCVCVASQHIENHDLIYIIYNIIFGVFNMLMVRKYGKTMSRHFMQVSLQVSDHRSCHFYALHPGCMNSIQYILYLQRSDHGHSGLRMRWGQVHC